MGTVEQKARRPSKTYVQKRLRDWKRRVEALFRQIERWAVDEWGEQSVSWGKRMQRQEYPMKRAQVAAREFPTLHILAGKRRVDFLPRCLWIIGANGQIDVLAGSSAYALVDMAEEDGQPSNWEISNPNPRVVLEPFTREVLVRIARRAGR